MVMSKKWWESFKSGKLPDGKYTPAVKEEPGKEWWNVPPPPSLRAMVLQYLSELKESDTK